MKFAEIVNDFKKKWRAINKTRSEDYLLGGAVMALDLQRHLEAIAGKDSNEAALREQIKKLQRELDAALLRNREYRERQDSILNKSDELQRSLTAALQGGMQSNQGHGASHDEVVRLRKENRSLKEGARTMKATIEQNGQKINELNQNLRLINSIDPVSLQVKRLNMGKMMQRIEQFVCTSSRSFESRLQIILLTVRNYQALIENPDLERDYSIEKPLPIIPID